MGTTKQFVDYVTGMSFSQLPEPVVKRAKELILDTLGVTVAGVATPSATRVHNYVRQEGGNRVATVLGTDLRTTPTLAALANGTSSHAWDYDDTSLGIMIHSSGSAVSALLAVGEIQGSSGRDFLEAFVVGFEAMYRLTEGIHPEIYLKGFHATGLMGTLYCAASCAKLMGLPPDQVTCALSIACSMASGLRAQIGTDTKALHMGLAARNGVMATSLAAAGFTASPEVLEDAYAGTGFCSAHTGITQPRFTAIEKAFEDSKAYRLLDPGIGIKLSPTGTMALAVIPCVLRLVTQHDIQPQDVEKVEYGHSKLAGDIAPFDDPQDHAQALYSLTHCAAAPIVYRRAGIREFSEEALHDPRMVAMRKRVHHYTDPELDAMPDIKDVPACKVTIRLKDGRSYTSSLRRPDAYPGGIPLSREGLLEKFTDCVSQNLPAERAQECAPLVDRLEDVKNIQESLSQKSKLLTIIGASAD